MKKIIALFLALIFCFSVASCGTASNGDELGEIESTDFLGTETENSSESSAEVEEETKRAFEFVTRSDNDRIKEGEFTAVSKVSSKYVRKTGSTIFLDYTTPQFELGGIKAPAENSGVFYRLDASKRNTEYTKELSNKKVATMFATHSSGGTLRFRTNASTIVVYAKVKSFDGGIEIVGNRGTHGFDVYVGSGTAKEYCGGRMQMFAGSNGIEETVTLPGGYVEVLINFPIYAELLDIEIGFTDSKALIAAPLERDYAPIVFYGGDSAQGLGASRPGATYANTVCRMLNTDCINQGYVNGANGEQIIADYIAGLEMSAFVMDYDYGPDLETLKATHYNFYKTVRDAHPDIPIVMITKPIYTAKASEAEIERANVVKDTYKAAIDAGDENVYFINGDKVFPSGAMPDLFTIDRIHLSDTGMYYMALCVYDALSEAFTKAAK